MENTENLALPYIMPSQAQKHVTHNEALRMLDAIVHLAVLDKDLGAPPSDPDTGARYIVGVDPTGAWSGHANDIAAWQDGAWAFYAPGSGWLAWVHDESLHYLFSGTGWSQAPGSGAGIVPQGAWSDAQTYGIGDLVVHEGHAFLSNVDGNLDSEPDAVTPGSTAEWTHFAITGVNPVPLVGVNATADDTNRLAVASPASLFGHEGDDHRLKINKAAAGNTASVLFQTDFVGHAEFGLAGDNDWHVKVSPDGISWHEAIVVDRSTGVVSLPNTPDGRELLVAPRTYYVDASYGDDANNGLSSGAGAFATIQKAVDTAAGIDLGIHDVTISVADGTYAPVVLKQLVGAGRVQIVGNPSIPANVHLTSASNSVRVVEGIDIRSTYVLRGMKLSASGSSTRYCIYLSGEGTLDFGAVDFGDATHHMIAINKAVLVAGANYAISAGANRHWWAQQSGEIQANSRTVTLTGTPNFSGSFAFVTRLGGLACQNMTFSGSATGTRYSVQQLGIIFTGGAGANYLPGSSAGSENTTTSGHYV